MSVEQYDVIVVGTGPAGATAAYGLARAGLRTLLLEKARLPRYKTCGGGITHKSVVALPFSVEPVIERTLRRVDFSWRTTKPFVVESDEPLVYMVQRSRFDSYLTEQAVGAGATLMDETTVQSLDVGDHEVNICTSRGSFTADYVIGADGATGRVAKSIGLMPDRWALAALETEFEVEPSTMDHWRDKLGLDLGELPATYGWVFPKGDHLSVGVGGLPRIPDYGKRLKQYDTKHTAARVPGVKREIRTHGYLLPCRLPGAPVQKGRVLLVGDAAGLVEAFTGEGIYWAIRSGQIAAASIAKGQSVPDYQRQLDIALMPNLMSARRWLHIYIYFPYSCYWLPKHVPAFWRAMCLIVRGERHFVDIKRGLGPLGVIEKMLPETLIVKRA
jgi:geranylgeranyl reductase family protein